MNVLVRVLGFQKQKLGAHQAGDRVIDAADKEDDPLLQQSGENIVGALAAAGLFDHHRHQRIHLQIVESHGAIFLNGSARRRRPSSSRASSSGVTLAVGQCDRTQYMIDNLVLIDGGTQCIERTRIIAVGVEHFALLPRITPRLGDQAAIELFLGHLDAVALADLAEQQARDERGARRSRGIRL
jgi:hypothetical protein